MGAHFQPVGWRWEARPTHRLTDWHSFCVWPWQQSIWLFFNHNLVLDKPLLNATMEFSMTFILLIFFYFFFFLFSFFVFKLLEFIPTKIYLQFKVRLITLRQETTSLYKFLMSSVLGHVQFLMRQPHVWPSYRRVCVYMWIQAALNHMQLV